MCRVDKGGLKVLVGISQSKRPLGRRRFRSKDKNKTVYTLPGDG